MGRGGQRIACQSAADERWLSAAPSPAAISAASQRASCESASAGTSEYTPRCTR